MTRPLVTNSSRLITPDIQRFLLQALAWNIAFFGLLRLTWIEEHVVGAIVEFQTTLVTWYGVAAHKGIIVNASCSGTDVMALCGAITLAYPAPWRRRFAGAACGLAVILTLNAIRIATLYLAASDPARLDLLHLYVWPTTLAAVTAAYLFAWICWSERKSPVIDVDRRWVRFGLFTAGSLAVYAASVPWIFASPLMARMGTWTVGAGGAVLSLMGASVTTTGNVLLTGRGAFQVTPECLYTPMTALYLAAVLALPASGRRRLGWCLLGIPLFLAFGVVRLLVLALPPFVADSPVFLAHGFYQIVVGASAIMVAAHASLGASAGYGALRRSVAKASARAGLRASGRTVVALAAALAGAILLGPVWESALVRTAHIVQAIVPMTTATFVQAGDRQGALALLPAFQVGCMIGLWMAVTGGRNRRRLLTSLAVIAGSQLALLVVLGIIRSGLEIEPHALVIRGWALVVPLVIAAGWGAGGATVPVGEKPALAGQAAALAYAKPRVAIGVEYVVDARGCDPEALRSLPRLQALFARLLGELALEMAAAPVWHVFPGHGGITGVVLLAESHLTIHTFPESGCAAIDLYCCRRSADWPWAERLAESLGASEVEVKVIRRG